jgi:hypothetical protein
VRAPGVASPALAHSLAPRSLVWGRRILLVSSSIAVVVALAVMHLRWSTLMSELCRPPTPSLRATVPLLAAPAPSAGQHKLMEARRKIESGDGPAAQRLLQSIVPEDPAYPFAQRMQLELPRGADQP